MKDSTVVLHREGGEEIGLDNVRTMKQLTDTLNGMPDVVKVVISGVKKNMIMIADGNGGFKGV